MSSDVLTLAGVAVAAILAFLASRSSASAAEVTALGKRVTDLQARQDETDKIVRGLREYVAEDHDEHRRNDWPIRPLPEHLR